MPFALAAVADTDALARVLAPCLAVGDRLLIDGELGAGKTTFARALVAALGGDAAAVTSPTFALMQRYAARVPVVHVDAWRLRDGGELAGIGFDEAAAEAVAIVEWAARVLPASPAAWRIRLEHDGVGGRRAHVEPPAAMAESWLQAAAPLRSIAVP